MKLIDELWDAHYSRDNLDEISDKIEEKIGSKEMWKLLKNNLSMDNYFDALTVIVNNSSELK